MACIKSVRGVSIGPGEVAGYLSRLRTGFADLGVPCEHFLFIPPNAFNYSTSNYFLKRPFDRICRMRNGGIFGHVFFKLFDKILRFLAIIYAIFKYDCFIFSGFGSFFRFWELPLLRLFNKTIIVIYLGSDARPPYLSGRYLDDRNGRFSPTEIAAEASKMRKQMAWVERFASFIVNHTGTAQFAKKPFIRLCELGMPMAAPQICGAVSEDLKKRSIRILHAPTRPLAKGSMELRAAVSRMQQDGLAVELIELIGVSNAEVLKNLAECDIVFDELYSDVAVATFAAEAAMFRKPVVVGSLYASQFGRDNPSQSVAPTTFIVPDALEETLRSLVEDPALRAVEGQRLQNFVSVEYPPHKVAGRYSQLFDRSYPQHWLTKPRDISYLGGWGLPEGAWRDQMAKYLNEVGEEGLYLDDRPDLKAKILSFIKGAHIS